jgi:hypothetical protein
LRGDSNEQWYWHGTRQISPEVIAKEGFDFRVSNPGMYGRGAYFAHSINYSSRGYQHTIQQQSNPVPTQFIQSLASHPPTQSPLANPNPTHPQAYPPPLAPGSNPRTPYVTIDPLVPGSPSLPQRIRHRGARATLAFDDAAPNIPAFRLMNLPPSVGPGDSQLILARVCVGRTAVLPANNVRLSFLLLLSC